MREVMKEIALNCPACSSFMFNAKSFETENLTCPHCGSTMSVRLQKQSLNVRLINIVDMEWENKERRASGAKRMMAYSERALSAAR